MSNLKIIAESTNMATKNLTIDGSASQNMFQITGIVRVDSLYGEVETAIAADVTGAYLEVDDGTAQVALTLAGGAPALSSLPLGSYIVKSSLATAILGVHSSAAAAVSEVVRMTTSSRFVVIQKTAGVATYIRLTRAGAGATGRIHWHCLWEKISDGANLVAA